MNKKLLTISLTTAAFVALVGLRADQVSAVSKSFSDHPMISSLAERFGLNETEVTNFMEESRETRQIEMQQKFIDKLDEAVANGELTAAQKELIMTKHQEMEASRPSQREDWRDLSPEDKEALREQRQNKASEMKAWLEENGISNQYFGLGNASEMKGQGRGYHTGWGK